MLVSKRSPSDVVWLPDIAIWYSHTASANVNLHFHFVKMLAEIDAHPAVQRQLFMDNVYSYVLCDAVLKFK